MHAIHLMDVCLLHNFSKGVRFSFLSWTGNSVEQNRILLIVPITWSADIWMEFCYACYVPLLLVAGEHFPVEWPATC